MRVLFYDLLQIIDTQDYLKKKKIKKGNAHARNRYQDKSEEIRQKLRESKKSDF